MLIFTVLELLFLLICHGDIFRTPVEYFDWWNIAVLSMVAKISGPCMLMIELPQDSLSFFKNLLIYLKVTKTITEREGTREFIKVDTALFRNFLTSLPKCFDVPAECGALHVIDIP